MTPLRPGDLVPTAYSLGGSRAVKTKLVTAVKNQPKWLCSQSVPGTLRALGHIQPQVCTCPQSSGFATGNQRRNHFMALRIWKSKNLS